MFSYTTRGVCSKEIVYSIEDRIIKKVEFHGGCDGNLQAISRLVEGMKVEEAVDKLRGIQCGGKSTSCADQLALALDAELRKKAV